MSIKSDKDKKAFQSYLDNIKAKTGLTPADFRRLAKEKGLTKAGEVVAWLKTGLRVRLRSRRGDLASDRPCRRCQSQPD